MNYKNQAKKLQLDYFTNYNQSKIEKKGRAQNHWLQEEYASKGMNFYSDYNIFENAKKSRGNKNDTPEWFMDTLRSQHIPFNIFIPFLEEKDLCVNVLNNLLNISITDIIDLKIEFPYAYQNPLNDKTSFDAFISYKTKNGKGMLGIEVKYTEGGYSLSETEENHFPVYRDFTEKSGLYINSDEEKLTENRYRQIWRNHLLAYAYAEKNNYIEYISLTIYPKGNTHFVGAMKEYNEFLNKKGKATLKGITYEEFIETLIAKHNTAKQSKWIKYLIERYIVSDKDLLLNKLK